MNKILIIGSSYSIKNAFVKKFLDHNITFINFRDIWNNRNIDNFDLIILSGFHHAILKKKILDIDEYIKEYYQFFIELKKKTNQFYFISTFIPTNSSFSRVVYFYNNSIKKILLHKNVTILSFKKIVDSKFRKKFIYKLLIFFKIKLTNQEDLIENTENYILKKNANPQFIFINTPRNMFIERILRLLDKS